MTEPNAHRITASTVSTALDVAGAVLLTASGWFLMGIAGALGVAGGFCLALSYSLTRRS